MSIQGLSLIFPLLFICFLRESFCICDGTVWSRSGWDIFPEEAEYLIAKSSPSYCLPYPLDKVCYDSAYMDAFQDVLCLMYISAQALFLILTVLSVYCLLVKWKEYKEKVENKASLCTSSNDLRNQSLYDIHRTLCELATTTSRLTDRLNHLPHCPSANKVKYRSLKKKKIAGGRAKGYCTHSYANVTQSITELAQDIY